MYSQRQCYLAVCSCAALTAVSVSNLPLTPSFLPCGSFLILYMVTSIALTLVVILLFVPAVVSYAWCPSDCLSSRRFTKLYKISFCDFWFAGNRTHVGDVYFRELCIAALRRYIANEYRRAREAREQIASLRLGNVEILRCSASLIQKPRVPHFRAHRELLLVSNEDCKTLLEVPYTCSLRHGGSSVAAPSTHPPPPTCS